MNIGDIVIYDGGLKLRELDNGTKYAITTDVYKVESLQEDYGGYIDVIDMNTNKPLRARKDCLIKIY